jgi:hypothetical protein
VFDNPRKPQHVALSRDELRDILAGLLRVERETIPNGALLVAPSVVRSALR